MRGFTKLAVAACAFGAALGLTAISAAALEKVVIGSSAPPSPPYSHLVFAEKLGFFEQEGLEPEFVSVQGSAVLIPQIASNEIDFGWPNPDLMVIALSKGEPFPVKFFFNYNRVSPFEFVVLQDSPIQSLADLKGKKLGVGALGWGNIPMSKAILADQGVKWMEDVEVLPVGVGQQAWDRLVSGEIDVLNLYTAQHTMIELSGHPLRRLTLPEKFQSVFANGWITSDEKIRDKPELVAAMGRIIAKSAIACRANPEACARSFWDFDPTSKPAAEDEAKWVKDNAALNAGELSLLFKNLPDEKQLGIYSDDAWKSFVALLAEAGLIPSADIAYKDLYTNAFIERINDFDHDEVLRAAAEAK